MRRSPPAAAFAAMSILVIIAPACGIAKGLAQPDSAVADSAVAPDNATAYFDRARKLGFPSAGQAESYVLRAGFTTRANSGVVTTGAYTDTFLDEKHWRREAVLGESRFVRSRSGKTWYRQDDGPDATLLQFVLTTLEPLPGKKSGNGREWKIQRDLVNGTIATQISRGKESATGNPDPKNFETYWFDASGQLTRCYLNGLEIKMENFDDFNGVHVARLYEVILGGKVGMKISITALQPLGPADSKIVILKGDEWRRGNTEEVR